MQTPNYEYDKRRFETFIDAIIAIILTILVLELRVQEGGQGELLSTKQQLLKLLPSFVSYIGSFLLITGIWIDHHLMFLNLHRINKRFILLNMLFFLSLSLIPATTAFAGNHYKDPFAVAVLYVNYFVMNLFFGALFWYSHWKGLLQPGYLADNKKTGIYSILGIIGLLIAIPLAYVNTYLSFGLGIFIFAGHLFKKN